MTGLAVKKIVRTIANAWHWLSRRHWHISQLIPIHKVQHTPISFKHHIYKSHNNPYFSLASRPTYGWYMVELQIQFLPTRANAVIYSNRDNEEPAGHKLSLISGRVCKRLIYLKENAELHFEFELAGSAYELQHFKLTKVTKKFAHSRMLRKLYSLHPRYKAEQNKLQKKFPLLPLAEVDQALWHDYCALFEDSSKLISYSEWIQKHDTLDNDMRFIMNENIKKFAQYPLITIVLPLFFANSKILKKTIESIQGQIYRNWELFLIAENPISNSEVDKNLTFFLETDKRINLVCTKPNEHKFTTLNNALHQSNGEWFIYLHHDGLLAEQALYWVVNEINKHPESRIIYTDEDKINELGVRSDPYFKCSWDPNLFYSHNGFLRFSAFHMNLVRKTGGLRIELEGAQDLDLTLRCIENIPPHTIRNIPRVLYHCHIPSEINPEYMEVNSYVTFAREKAINEHMKRVGINAKAEATKNGYRVRYGLPDNLPLVSLIIPTRNEVNTLRKCVDSILQKTTYANFEILIVDNGSDDLATLKYLSEIVCDTRIRVIRDDRPFNYSALNNSAVKQAVGEVIGLINNDVEVINSDWLSEMVSHALRPETGAVGARLWYADDTIQHAGVILGLEGFAGHVHRYLPRGNSGYFGRAEMIQSYSAVTGACLVIRKSIYEEVGGLNEIDLQVACNDIDFCLRVRNAGYRNIWTPYAELYHHESTSRGYDDSPEKIARANKETTYMWRHWGDLLHNDPAYNPNLSLDFVDFSLAWPPRVERAAPMV